MKKWLNVNLAQNHAMKEINKIIVNKSVKFYSKAWMHRNEIFHKLEAYRSHVIDWYERLKNEILEGNRPNLRR